LPKTKTSSVFAGEPNLTVVASVWVAARIYWLLQEKLPLVHSPRERHSRVNRTARATNFFFTRDIKKSIKFEPSIGRWNIKRSAAVTETFHRNVTFSQGDKVVHARVASYDVILFMSITILNTAECSLGRRSKVTTGRNQGPDAEGTSGNHSD